MRDKDRRILNSYKNSRMKLLKETTKKEIEKENNLPNDMDQIEYEIIELTNKLQSY